jgi:hypothetical protein
VSRSAINMFWLIIYLDTVLDGEKFARGACSNEIQKIRL